MWQLARILLPWGMPGVAVGLIVTTGLTIGRRVAVGHCPGVGAGVGPASFKVAAVRGRVAKGAMQGGSPT